MEMKDKVIDFLNILLGFRKFLAWFGLFIVGIIFRLDNYINGQEWTDLMRYTFAGFVAGNGVEYIATTVKEHLAIKRAQLQQNIPVQQPTSDYSEEK